MQDINAWIKGDQDYNVGVNLYSKYGQSDFIKKLLSAGPTPFNIKKLEAELLKLAPALPANIDNIIQIQPEPKEQVKQASALKDHIRLLELESLKSSLYREVERHMSMLSILEDQVQLHKTAKQILLKHKEISMVWASIDYYNETGAFEETLEKEPPVTSKRQRLHVSLSKAKTRLASGKSKTAEKTKALIDKIKNELKDLKP